MIHDSPEFGKLFGALTFDEVSDFRSSVNKRNIKEGYDEGEEQETECDAKKHKRATTGITMATCPSMQSDGSAYEKANIKEDGGNQQAP